MDLRHFPAISVGGGHKASRASPLGRARAACFECSALVPAEHGAVGRESLLLYWMKICKQHRPWSANTPADHYFVLGRTIAGQNQGRRFKAFSANKTQRVRTECFVRMLILGQELNFERQLVFVQELNLCANADFGTRTEPQAYADLWARTELCANADLWARDEFLTGAGLCSRSEPLCGC